jgi:hypothetical protein
MQQKSVKMETWKLAALIIGIAAIAVAATMFVQGSYFKGQIIETDRMIDSDMDIEKIETDVKTDTNADMDLAFTNFGSDIDRLKSDIDVIQLEITDKHADSFIDKLKRLLADSDFERDMDVYVGRFMDKIDALKRDVDADVPFVLSFEKHIDMDVDAFMMDLGFEKTNEDFQKSFADMFNRLKSDMDMDIDEGTLKFTEDFEMAFSDFESDMDRIMADAPKEDIDALKAFSSDMDRLRMDFDSDVDMDGVDLAIDNFIDSFNRLVIEMDFADGKVL